MKNTSKKCTLEVQRIPCTYSDFIEVMGVLFLCIYSNCVIVLYTNNKMEYGVPQGWEI